MTSRTLAEIEEVQARRELEALNKSVIERYWTGKWNDRRPETLYELQSPQVVYHGTSMQMQGIEEYRQVYEAFLSAFQDTHLVIEDLIAEGDKVASRVSMQAKHRGELEGIPATGREVTLRAFTVFRLVDGKITEEWEILDELGLIQQLELAPKAP